LDTRVPAKLDPHVGMKPSQGDDGASDGELELEDDLPYGGAIEVSRPMVKMMAALGDNDKWLPWSEQKKKDARITGEIVCPSQEIGGTHWCQGKRKSHWHGPDIAAKSEQMQRHPHHVQTMKNQKKLTTLGFRITSPHPSTSPLTSAPSS